MGRVTVTVTDRASHAAVAAVDYTVEAGPGPVALVGRSSSSNDHGPLTQCDVVRVYRFGGPVDSDLAESGAKALYLSDEPGISTASQLDTALGALFNRHPNTLVYWMPANEITANDLTQAQATAYINKSASHAAVVARYPNAFMGINITAYGVRQNRHVLLKPCAEHLDIIIASCYNPGRNDSPPTWNPYPGYLDPILDVVQDWDVPAFGVGEFGNPISPTDPNKRPSYAAGMLRYLRDQCIVRGIRFDGACWWDQQKTGGPNNRLSTDNPLTAQTWKTALN